MPSSTFQDSEPKNYELWPVGDYLGRVNACEFGISKGGKTGGSDTMDLTIEFVRKNPATGKEDKKEVSEGFIFHPSCEWKLDIFAKAFNLEIDGKRPAKGQPIDWTERAVCGLQGWSTLGVRDYVGRDGKAKKINEVVAFITNKERLPKIVDIDPFAAPVAAVENDDPFA